jgi:hypothetical protein
MKKIIIILGLLLIIGGVIFFLTKNSNKSNQATEDIPTPTMALPTISESVKVDLTPVDGGKAVKLSVSDVPSDTDTIEYEISYTTGSGIPRGVLGKITVGGEKNVSRDNITLGTCSSGKCVIDSGIISVDLSLKFNSSSGDSKVFRKSYPVGK